MSGQSMFQQFSTQYSIAIFLTMEKCRHSILAKNKDISHIELVQSAKGLSCWYSWHTDYTLRESTRQDTNFKTSGTIDLTGNDHITDQGIIWMCNYLNSDMKLEKIILKSCSKLTEISLFAIINRVSSPAMIDMSHTAIKYIPEECSEAYNIIANNCLSAYQSYTPKSKDTGSYSLMMWPCKSIEFSGIGLFSEFSERPFSSNYLEHATNLKIGGDLPLVNIFNYRLTEVPIHIFVPKNPGQIILLLSDEKEESYKHLIESVVYFLASEVPVVSCPKIILPSYRTSKLSLSDDREERKPMFKAQKMMSKTAKKSKFASKNIEEEPYSFDQCPFLEYSSFGFKNISIEDTVLKHLRGSGYWISKIPVDQLHSVFQISTTNDSDELIQISTGFCIFDPDHWKYTDPSDKPLFLYDMAQGVISYKKFEDKGVHQLKNVFSCRSLVVNSQIKETDNIYNLFVSLSVDEEIVWSFVFKLSTINNLVPFVIINQNNLSLEISGDWKVSGDRILKDDIKIEPTTTENLLKFVAVCVGPKCKEIVEDISKFDWKSKLDPYVKQLEDLIANIEKKDVEFIEIVDCKKLSEAIRQLEQINDFIQTNKKRLFLFNMEKADKKEIGKVISCIGDNIKSSMMSHRFNFSPNIFNEASQKIMDLGKTYVTANLLSQLNISRNAKLTEHIFQKMFSEARGIYVASFKLFILDIGWFDTLLNEIITNIPFNADYRVFGVHPRSKVWTMSSLIELLNRHKIVHKDHMLWTEFLMSLGLLVRLPCIRKSTMDEHYLFANPMIGGMEDKSHLESIRKSAEGIPQKVEAKVKYGKICQDLYSLYPQLLSKINSIGQLQLLSPIASVFHISGGTELLIQSGEDHITISVYMPLPLLNNYSAKIKLNLMHYLWSILHLCIDAFDALLSQQGLLSFKLLSATEEVPPNYSVSYVHKWHTETKHNNICSMCGNCSSIEGINCPYNRINSQRRGVCLCLRPSRTCIDCGICGSCAEIHLSNHCESDPCRLIMCDSDGLINPDIPINVPLGSTFSIDVFTPDSTIFMGLYLEGANKTIDIFGVTDSEKQHTAIEISDSNDILSPLDVSNFTFSISELLFERYPQYQFSTCYGINVVQEFGILTYDHDSDVGLVVGQIPISEERNKFSMEITNSGEYGRITIGLVNANYHIGQPGWLYYSIAYHGDDGGIYISDSEKPKRVYETYTEIGARIEVTVEYVWSSDKNNRDRFISWHKNGKLIDKCLIEYDEPLYPAIGFHSKYEQVKLLDDRVWRNDLLSDDDRTKDKFNIPLTVSPKGFLCFKHVETISTVFHVIPGKTDITTLDFKISHKSGSLVCIISALQSFNRLNSTGNSPGKWKFENVSKPINNLFTFQLTISEIKSLSDLRDYYLDLTVLAKSEEPITIQWEFTHFKQTRRINSCVTEVPGPLTVPECPSFLLTTIQDSIEKGGEAKYYHIPRGKYHLIIKATTTDAWIKCEKFIKPKVTPTFQIGNIVSFNSTPSVVIYANKATKQIKVTGYSEHVSFDDKRIKPLLRPGKSLLTLKSSNDNKFLYANVINKSLLFIPPPSRPLVTPKVLDIKMSFASELYFANECSEYHGLNICLLNVICSSHDDVIKPDKYHMVALPFRQKNRDIVDLLWHHSLIDLIRWDNILLYPLCAGKSSLYDSKCHLIDIKGIEVFDKDDTSPNAYKKIFLNPKLLDAHRSLLKHKFIFQKYSSILPKAEIGFSETQIESLIFSILEKLTNYMVLSNLLCEEKDLFNENLTVDWSQIFENGSYPALTMDTNGVSCKLHSTNHSAEINLDELATAQNLVVDGGQGHGLINNPIFDYAKCSQSVIFSGKTTKDVPEELFLKFSNLTSLEIRNMFQLEVLPNSIYNLRGLQRLIISQVKLKTLPEIYKFTNLKQLQIIQCPIVNQSETNGCTKLEIVKLSALPLNIFSTFFCYQENLVSLEIQLHGLQMLPNELKNLQKLKELKLIGSPLYYELAKNESALKFQENLEFCYPEINIYSVADKKKNPLSFLSVADTFTNVPRIGSGYSTSVDTLNHGGFPTVVLELRQLASLSIHHHSIRYVPEDIQHLENLENLDLSFNPLLVRIPKEISLIKSMKKLNLLHCPSLTIPPPEVIGRGSTATLSFLRYLLAKNVTCNRTKLMFVGLGEAGKTTLLHALISSTNCAGETIRNSNTVTDGIDIAKWTVSYDDEEIQYSTWDFAGQDIYYNTHQFFLSPQAIYIVVWSVRQGIEHGDLDFWLSSIACHAKDAPVFVVGTRCDQVQADTSCFNSIKQRYSQIEDFKLVDSFTGTGIQDLKQSLIKVTLNLPYMHKIIPSSFLELEAKILDFRKKTASDYMTLQAFEDISLSVGILKKDVKNVMQVLHDFGSIQYFDTDMLRSHVVINPQWIVDIMANVVSIVNQKIKNGIFYHHHMKEVWAEFDIKLHNWMLDLTEEFDLTFPHPSLDPKANIVPCLLSEEEPEIKWPIFPPESRCKYYQVNYNFEFLPAGLFNRIQVRLFDFTETKNIWKFGTYFEKKGHHILLKREKKNILTIRALGVRPVNILAMIDDVVRGLIKTSFYGVVYSLEISCPDCIEYGYNQSNSATNYWSQISMINSKIVTKAILKRVDYLQCSELHLNTIKSIKESTPETSTAEEFIDDIMMKLQTVQGLYASVEKSVVLLYSEADFQGKNSLSISEFNTMFRELNLICVKINESSTAKWKTSVSNCHLCLICLSENFIKIPQMNDVLEYIKFMKKKFILLILSEDRAIQSKWEYYLYFMTVFIRLTTTEADIMEAHFNELKNAIRLSTLDSGDDQDLCESYDCFISYCWSNSQDAVNKGKKTNPGSIISSEADPRSLYKYLKENGINCWIDDNDLVKTTTLNKQLSQNLRKSKMMVSFVSQDYSESDNCKMELNFMVEELRRPIVYVLTGSNMDWRFDSEIGLIMKKKDKHRVVDFSNIFSINKERLLKMVKETLNDCPEVAVRKEIIEDISPMSTALIEQVELIYRQFLNQLMMLKLEHCPRLVVLDVNWSETNSKISESVDSNNFQKSLDDDDVSRDNAYYIRVICENEGGWHVTDDKYQVAPQDRDSIIESCSVYLYMIYQILEYKNPGLECLQLDNINKTDLISRITQIASTKPMDFQESYSNMIQYYMKYDPDLSQCSLKRYRLASGRELWMCDKDAACHPRSKLIERDAATIESIVFPFEDYEKSFVAEIVKTKSGEEMLKYADSFAETIKMYKTNYVDENDAVGPLPRIVRSKDPYLRRDTILNIERDIVTDMSATCLRPLRRNSSQGPASYSSTKKRSMSTDQQNSIGSRICSIQ